MVLHLEVPSLLGPVMVYDCPELSTYIRGGLDGAGVSLLKWHHPRRNGGQYSTNAALPLPPVSSCM
jgi:hypothetical protein